MCNHHSNCACKMLKKRTSWSKRTFGVDSGVTNRICIRRAMSSHKNWFDPLYLFAMAIRKSVSCALAGRGKSSIGHKITYHIGMVHVGVNPLFPLPPIQLLRSWSEHPRKRFSSVAASAVVEAQEPRPVNIESSRATHPSGVVGSDKEIW
jgi:hypothetical protein